MTSLFRARGLDPLTSHAAADQSIDLAKQHFEKIVECLRRFGPMGKDGIAELVGLDGNQVARRMKELEKDGREFEAIWFNHADTLPDQIRAAYRLDINEYNGRSLVQLLVEFAEPA
jgi:DNA-binding Lrp family transcriptional regulator